MVIGIFGESCVGKSTLAEKLKDRLHAQIYTGKDYLRMAKDEASAAACFRKKLEETAADDAVIYVISEKEQLDLLPETAIRVLVTADLALIQERFARRMGGKLPVPVAAMLEKKHGCFDGEKHDLHVIFGRSDLQEVCTRIVSLKHA